MVVFLLRSAVGLRLIKKSKQIAPFELTLRALTKCPSGASRRLDRSPTALIGQIFDLSVLMIKTLLACKKLCFSPAIWAFCLCAKLYSIMRPDPSVMGHGILISGLEARVRRLEQHLNMPAMEVH
jgi:hypothetical protein